MRVRLSILGFAGLSSLWLAAASCADDSDAKDPFEFGGAGGAGASGGTGGASGADGGGVGGVSGSGATGGVAGSGGTAGALCATTFTYKPEAGKAVTSVGLAGEWNDFKPAPMAGPDANGAFSASVELAPGLWGYKLVLNGADWQLDPGQGYRKYVSGTENSAVRVRDCSVPALVVKSNGSKPTSFSTTLGFVPAKSGAGIDAAGVSATLKHAGTETAVPGTAISVDKAAGTVTVMLSSLANGKYTVLVKAKDTAGAVSQPLRLPFWIEPERFEWSDALIYMVMTDRFKDGDKSNNAAPAAGVQDARGDFKGGDLQGLTQRIADGTLDSLGVRAIWLTPFQTNPQKAYLASDNYHLVTGYHGYWPIKAREVDARIGGEQALDALVKEAHAHGIRILMDYVANHVHEEHEYFKSHPEWFRTGCVCGTSGCGWTEKRLECLFTPYMPDVNWTSTEASEQFVDDAVWWLDRFDLDGLRVDAVKHVEDLAIRNLSTRVHEEMEQAGTPYFLMGETAMGWSDCGLDCNKGEYGTISQYIGPFALDGQFDFVLYHGVPYRVFAYDEKGFLHADYWAQQSQTQYPAGSVMTPFIGSHDSSRFVTLATYRGQPGYDKGVPGNQWSSVAGPPPDAEPYARHSLALSWLLGLPGAPLLYYGDEYGEWGGADPGNRAMWRGDQTLSANEQAVLARTKKLGQARRELLALRRGAYRSLHATETFLAYARETSDGKVAIVALSRDPNATTTEVAIPLTLPVPNGTVLKDRLGGANVTVSGGKLSVTLQGRGAAVLAP